MMKEKTSGAFKSAPSNAVDDDDNLPEGKLVIDLDAGQSMDAVTPNDPTPTEPQQQGKKISSTKSSGAKRKATPTTSGGGGVDSDDQHSAGDNSNSAADNQNFRLKIKRKKMATRLSGARHEVVPSPSDSQEPNGLVSDVTADKMSTSTSNTLSDEKLERRDVGTWVRTVGSATDAECFGPCEPGTAVTLEGIVWHETAGGVLVVNVTWRGKSYVGTLLDCTKSDWAAPRFCESPNSDLDGSKTPAKGRGLNKRCAGGSAAALNNNRSNATSSSSSNDGNGGGGGGGGSKTAKQQHNQNQDLGGGGGEGQSQPVESSESAAKIELILEPMSPLLFECPLRGCEKKYGQITALKYHQSSSHFPASSSMKEKETSTSTTHLVDAACATSNEDQEQSAATKLSEAATKLSEAATKLSEAEHESLESLFKVVDQQQQLQHSGGSSDGKAPPNLSAADGSSRTTAGSPAYSDISDDEEAPKLERLSSPTNKNFGDENAAKIQEQIQLKKQEKALSPPVTAVLVENGPIVGGETSSGKDKNVDLKVQTGKLPLVNNAGVGAVNQTKKIVIQQQQPMDGKYQTVIKKEQCASPAPLAEKKNGHSNNVVVPSSSIAAYSFTSSSFPTYQPQPAPPPHMVMASQCAGVPYDSLYGAPSMFAFPLNAANPLNQSAAMYFGVPIAQMPGVASHKIHELSETTVVSKMSPTPANVNGGGASGGTGEPKKILVVEASSKSRRDDSSKSDSSSRSPPVQRHLHTHHHTHTYPMIPPQVDYAALMAATHSQQSAAGMVGAFPVAPYARK